MPAPNGQFSPVEQIWHWADLEREGFGERIQRLVSEVDPRLPNFDGNQIAAERNYRSLSISEGLLAFSVARQKNIAILKSLDSEVLLRQGIQEGVAHAPPSPPCSADTGL